MFSGGSFLSRQRGRQITVYRDWRSKKHYALTCAIPLALRDALRQSLPTCSSFGAALRQAVLVRIPPKMPHPSACLCSLPRNRAVAWFPKVSILQILKVLQILSPSLLCAHLIPGHG